MSAPAVRVTKLVAETIARDGVLASSLLVPGVVDLFLHNWANNVQIENAYSTDVTRSATSLAEERRGLVDRPLKTITFQWRGLDAGTVRRLILGLARAAHGRFQVPLYSDFAPTTATSTSAPEWDDLFGSGDSDPDTGTYLYVDTRYRRFFEGAKVAVYTPGQGTSISNVYYKKILRVEPDRLLVETVGFLHAANAIVLPLIDAELSLESGVDLVTDIAGDVDLSVVEVTGATALPPTLTGLPDVPTFDGYPILQTESDWGSGQKIRLVRGGERRDLGRGALVVTGGTRPQFEFEFRMLASTRADVWKLINFADSRRGRLLPFWVAAPNALFGDVVGISTGYVDISQVGNLQDIQEFVKHVAVVTTVGVVHVSKIDSIGVNGGNWRILLLDALPVLTLAEVRRATSAHLVRFAKDAFTENWITDSICRMQWDLLELLEEKDVPTTGLEP